MAGRRAGTELRLVKPLTFMNRSGAVLAPLRASADFDPAQELLVLVDEAMLPAGRLRLRASGSAGGHNGLKSIEEALGSRDYARLRIGVGPVPEGLDELSEFVLEAPSRPERALLRDLMDPAADAVECWLSDGIETAMNRYNR